MIVLTGMQSICCGVEDLNRVDFSKGKYDPTTYNDLYEDKTATIGRDNEIISFAYADQD